MVDSPFLLHKGVLFSACGPGRWVCGCAARGCTPIFFLRHQKENAPCTVEKKKCSGRPNGPWPFGGKKRECSETVQWGLRFAGPSIVFYRVRRTWVEQR
jgi:hypothetical protein